MSNREEKVEGGLEVVAWRYTSSHSFGRKDQRWHYQENFPEAGARQVQEIGQLEPLVRQSDAERAVQQEMERHRKTWRQLEQVQRELKAAREIAEHNANCFGELMSKQLSQQADVAEPAPAQDELIPRNQAIAEAFREGVEWQRTRPAQAEQQLVPGLAEAPSRVEAVIVAIRDLWDEDECPAYPVVAKALREMLSSAPVAQTDPWTPSGADYDRAVHHNPDAKAWADLFVETFPGLADKRDLMIGWFANAMMAMHDHLARKAAPQPEKSGWISPADALPEPYIDVFIRRKDGTYCVGRLDHKGSWQRAAYQHNRHQYTVTQDEIDAWFGPHLPTGRTS